jgi:hypothetical protein
MLEIKKSGFPEIVTLCGSTRFKDIFETVIKKLTLEGKIVISVGLFGHSGDPITEEQKAMLDELHLRKIDIADTVYIINFNNYIGESTRKEIEYAEKHGKKIQYHINWKDE